MEEYNDQTESTKENKFFNLKELFKEFKYAVQS